MKNILLGIVSSILIFAPIALSIAVYADSASQQQVCEGIGVTGAKCTAAGDNTSIDGIVKAVVSILSIIVGVAAVIMLIIGGLKYVTSGGDSNAVSSAKNTVLYALIGLVVAVLAQFIVHFIINKTTTG